MKIVFSYVHQFKNIHNFQQLKIQKSLHIQDQTLQEKIYIYIKGTIIIILIIGVHFNLILSSIENYQISYILIDIWQQAMLSF